MLSGAAARSWRYPRSQPDWGRRHVGKGRSRSCCGRCARLVIKAIRPAVDCADLDDLGIREHRPSPLVTAGDVETDRIVDRLSNGPPTGCVDHIRS
jgi:hypothetical protein